MAEQRVADRLASAERVLKAAADIRKLRHRLAELDRERAAIEKKIAQRFADLTGAPPPEPAPALQPAPSSLSENILAVIEGDPDTIVTAMDFAARWDAREIGNYRATLWRLQARGKIRRVSPGRYTAIPKRNG